MSTIKLVFSTLIIAFSLMTSSTYANTLPVDTEIIPVEIEQAKNTMGWGPVQVFLMSNTATVGTSVGIFAGANDPQGKLQNLTILVNGQPIASGTSNMISGTFTPTVTGKYVVTARAIYEGFHMVFATPTGIIVN